MKTYTSVLFLGGLLATTLPAFAQYGTEIVGEAGCTEPKPVAIVEEAGCEDPNFHEAAAVNNQERAIHIFQEKEEKIHQIVIQNNFQEPLQENAATQFPTETYQRNIQNPVSLKENRQPQKTAPEKEATTIKSIRSPEPQTPSEIQIPQNKITEEVTTRPQDDKNIIDETGITLDTLTELVDSINYDEDQALEDILGEIISDIGELDYEGELPDMSEYDFNLVKKYVSPNHSLILATGQTKKGVETMGNTENIEHGSAIIEERKHESAGNILSNNLREIILLSFLIFLLYCFALI